MSFDFQEEPASPRRYERSSQGGHFLLTCMAVAGGTLLAIAVIVGIAVVGWLTYTGHQEGERLKKLSAEPKRISDPTPKADAIPKTENDVSETTRLFRSDDNSYTIRFPEGEFKIEKTEHGEDRSVTKGDLSFAVKYSPYDATKTSLEEVMEGMAEIDNKRGRVLYSKEMRLQGRLAHETSVAIKGTKDMVLRSRRVVVPGRVYQIMVLGPKVRVDAREANSFINSFKMID